VVTERVATVCTHAVVVRHAQPVGTAHAVVVRHAQPVGTAHAVVVRHAQPAGTALVSATLQNLANSAEGDSF
jgi:hypothetical protein